MDINIIESFSWAPASEYVMREFILFGYGITHQPLASLSGNSPSSFNPHTFFDRPTNHWTTPSDFRKIVSDLERAQFIERIANNTYSVTEDGLNMFRDNLTTKTREHHETIQKMQLEIQQLQTQVDINRYTLQDWRTNKWIALLGIIIAVAALVISIVPLLLQKN